MSEKKRFLLDALHGADRAVSAARNDAERAAATADATRITQLLEQETKAEYAAKPLSHKIPGVGPYIESADKFVESYIGRPPDAKESVQGLSDMARIGVDSISLGGADYLGGADQKKLTDEARQRMGLGGTAVDVGAGFFSPGLPVKVAGKVGAVGRAAESGAQSVADAYLHGETNPWELAKQFGAGSGINYGLEKVASPVLNWWSRRNERDKAIAQHPYKDPKVMAAEKAARYKALDNAGVSYAAKDAKELAGAFRRTVADAPIGSEGTDKAKELLGKLETGYRGKDVTPSKLDEVRRTTREELVEKGDASYSRTGNRMITNIDEFADKYPLTKAPAGGIHYQGPRAPASQQAKVDLKTGRDLAHREAKDNFIDKTLTRAEQRVLVKEGNPFTPSLESERRSKAFELKNKVEDNKAPGQFTADEQAKLQKIWESTPFRRWAEKAEKFSFSGKQLGQLGSGAKAMKWGTVGILPTVAEAMTRLGNAATKRDIEDLRYLIRDPSGKGVNRPANEMDVKAMQRKLAAIMASSYRASDREKK